MTSMRSGPNYDHATPGFGVSAPHEGPINIPEE